VQQWRLRFPSFEGRVERVEVTIAGAKCTTNAPWPDVVVMLK
jgi:hypothetical protein